MQIGLNGQKLLVKNLAGPEVYTFNTYRSFAKLDKSNDYLVYFEKKPPDELWKSLSNNNSRFKYKVLPKKLSWTHVSLAWELFKNPVDVYFAANHTLPLLRPKKTKFISMIHGLEYKINKQFYKNPFKLLIHPFIIWFVLFFSKIVIVPSKSVKEMLSKRRWPFIKSDKLRIIHEGVDESYYKRPRSEINEVRKTYELGDHPYLFFVSTIQPRKNIPRMVEAFSRALKENEEFRDLSLVISGKKGWLYEESLAAPKKYSVEDNVKFLGFTPDEDLPILLSGARYFISCSFDEGFGLPLLQAMACETLGIVSDIPAFRELGRDTPYYLNPKNINSIKNGMITALKTPINSRRIKRAKEISQAYTWEKGAQQIISIFNSFFKHL